jgi:hypothetical protein
MSFFDSLENEVRRKPVQSAGLILTLASLVFRLPMLALIGWIVRTALSLVRPVLVVLGVVKALELVWSLKGAVLWASAAFDKISSTNVEVIPVMDSTKR